MVTIPLSTGPTLILLSISPTIDITLELESTSDACVECVGLIESRIRVGPVERGTEIVVNGIRVVV